MIKSTVLEFLSDFYIFCMRGTKAKFTFRALSNLSKNIGALCIRSGNLKFDKFHKSYANQKKIGYPNFLTG